MDFRDKDGGPLVSWHDADSAFEAWKKRSAGRPCDYTGLSHARLRASESGIQWPCNDQYPDGTERLYTDGISWAGPDMCESYGKDLLTGAERSEVEYGALNPSGRAITGIGAHYGLDLSGPPGKTTPGGLLASLREKSAEAIGRRPEPALLLLHDLRELHLAAAGNSLYWEMLAQAAQGGRDRRLLDLSAACHPRNLRQKSWSNTLIKIISAQALTAL
jgi:hypothetical protein